jgi:hypothetical protein
MDKKYVKWAKAWHAYVKGRWYANTAREILAEAGPRGSIGTPIWYEFYAYFTERDFRPWRRNLLVIRPHGQGTLEYVLILGLIAGVVILLLLAIGMQTNDFLRSVVEAFK